MAEERVLTLRELNRALLARQLLLERRKLGVQKAVETLCAIQAQWPQSPYIALWTRLTGFRKEQLTRAVELHSDVDVDHYDVTHHLEGNFPGGQVDLHYRFALSDGVIARLVIEP